MTDELTKDPVALGLGSLASGVGFGAACLTAAQIVASILRGELEPTVYHEIAWYRSFSLENIWQRGVIAVLAAVGASLVGFLAALLDRFLGMIGLIIWLLFNIALGIIAARWAIKGKGTVTP